MSDSWSVSRARALARCHREYYYRYHLAPLARRPDPAPEVLEVDRVRGLVGLEAWAGEVVHEVIRAALNRWRGGRGMGEGEAVEHAARLLSRQFRVCATTGQLPQKRTRVVLRSWTSTTTAMAA